MLKILAYHHYCQYPTLQNHHHYFPLPLPSFLLFFSFFIYPNWIRKKKENWYLWRTSCMLDNFIYVFSFDLFPHRNLYSQYLSVSVSLSVYVYIQGSLNPRTHKYTGKWPSRAMNPSLSCPKAWLTEGEMNYCVIPLGWISCFLNLIFLFLGLHTHFGGVLSFV